MAKVFVLSSSTNSRISERTKSQVSLEKCPAAEFLADAKYVAI
jgi:hypothetical protein